MPEPDVNEWGQPVGFAVLAWTPPPFPPDDRMTGRLCHMERLNVNRHAVDLYSANSASGRDWTYLSEPPPSSFETYCKWVERAVSRPDAQFWAIIDNGCGKAVGVAAYMRVDPSAGSIEVGHVHFSPQIQRTATATEAMFLMMQRAFSLGYRRYEWKCNALNAASRAAAQRLGFTFEGTFRQARVVKGHSRDTAWYSVIDTEWPRLEGVFRQWLDPLNFDRAGRQRTSLSTLTAPTARGG